MSLKKKRRGEKWQRRRKDAAGSIKIKRKLHLREDKSLWIKLQETDMCKCVSVFVTDVSREQTSKVIRHFLRSGQQKEKNSWNYKKKCNLSWNKLISVAELQGGKGEAAATPAKIFATPIFESTETFLPQAGFSQTAPKYHLYFSTPGQFISIFTYEPFF